MLILFEYKIGEKYNLNKKPLKIEKKMPFLGKDWRSGGDQWIRTDLGWERTKVLESILDNLNIG